MKRILSLLAALIVLALPASHAQAQSGNPFAPVILVNELGVTGFEIDQRMAFLGMLRQTGDLREAAETALIEDRLRVWAAKQMGLSVTDEAVAQGMGEFAGRANLTTEQFITELAKGGVEAQTFRDFVSAGMLWREVVKARFGPRVQISEAEIDRALLVESQRGQGTRVLISEIIIPAPPGREAEAMAAARRAAAAKGEGAFGALARELSAANTAGQGGRLDWMPIEKLPPTLRPVILGLAPGQATQPIEIPDAVAVFLLRGIDEGGPVSSAPLRLGYAQLIVGAQADPASATQAADFAAKADRCDDLYGLAQDLPADRLLRDTADPGAVPADLAPVLANLDIGESAVVTRGANRVLVMLCSRERAVQLAPDMGAGAPAAEGEDAGAEDDTDPGPDRNAIKAQLQNDRLTGYAESYMADLLSEAVIVRP